MYTLMDGVKQNKDCPETFEIPSKQEKEKLKVGEHVKLCFEEFGQSSERMWV
ncbi:hypothetical protein [Brevibacillus laterosporus]|uniref:hypothetical protein n=1 Tax=Brevibacillus laterosporus TaxID=1465 RepID=UPI003D192AF1